MLTQCETPHITALPYYGYCLSFWEPIEDSLADEFEQRIQHRRTRVDGIVRCKKCDSTFWPRRGEAGHKCPDCGQVFFSEPQFHKEHGDNLLTRTNEDSSQTAVIHAVKCLVFVTNYPYLNGFRSVLTQLYQICLSGRSTMPLERYAQSAAFAPPFAQSRSSHKTTIA